MIHYDIPPIDNMKRLGMTVSLLVSESVLRSENEFSRHRKCDVPSYVKIWHYGNTILEAGLIMALSDIKSLSVDHFVEVLRNEGYDDSIVQNFADN